jgi:hypothetical protein
MSNNLYYSHRKKREAKIKRDVKRGIREPNDQDPFEIFVTVTDIRYTCVVCYPIISTRNIHLQLLQGITEDSRKYLWNVCSAGF